jgi:crotonobetainyl-CoA:carnitine CoA-transferase CaiB-like acyl-CoA transferase
MAGLRSGSVDPSAVLASGGLRLPPGAALDLVGRDPVLPSRHHAGEAAAAAAGLAATWAARLGELRGLPAQIVTVDVTAAATSLLGFVFQSAGDAIDLTRDFSPATDLYRTADDRLIHLHGGFPHLATGTAALLGCTLDRAGLTAAVRSWAATDLEDALARAGLCGAVVRSPEEWADHPQGRAVNGLPAVRIQKVGDAPPGVPTAGVDRPLEGIRVLDLTRVLAGPTVGRTLAAHGADVLRITGPRLPTVEPFDVDTGRGKRNAFCDLDDPGDRERLDELVATADVFVSSYRPGALAARGLGVDALTERRPGLVVVNVSAYGPDGPWATRRGWEQLAQSCSGLAHAENPADPHLIPAAATDYTTGYLGAAGAVEALHRRATTGGSWAVDVSLCQTAAWLHRLGADLDPETASGFGDVAARQVEVDSGWGRLRALAPVEVLSRTPPRWDLPPTRLGTASLAWSTTRG